MNKRKLIISCLLISMPFLTSASDIKIPEFELDEYIFDFDENEGFINDFISEEKELNSSLHPNLDDSNIVDLYYVNNTFLDTYESYADLNIWPEKQFVDVLSDYGNNSTFSRVSVDDNGNQTFIGHISSYNNNYYVYKKYSDLILNKYGYNPNIYCESGYNYSSPFKIGFSSLDGISLVSNDIYINSNFNYNYSSNIDLALVNQSGYSINYLELLNELSYICANTQFQFPLIKVDNNELVNVIFNGSNAYIVTHNCEFSFTEDGNNYYLSIPYQRSIEKITFSIPFFTGGMGIEPLSRMDKKGNMYCYEYLSGSDIRNEIYKVMNGFKPYLFNDDINSKSHEFAEYCPLNIESFDLNNNIVYFKSINDFKFNSISLDITQKKIISNSSSNVKANFNYINKKQNSIRNYKNNVLSDVSDEQHSYSDYNIYSYSLSNNLLLDQDYNLKINNVTFSNNSLIDDLLDLNKNFNYYDSYTAKVCYGDFVYELNRNPEWWEFLDARWMCNGVVDDYKSYRQNLYFDFYWDKNFENKIEKIDSFYISLPRKEFYDTSSSELVKKRHPSVVLDIKNIQEMIDNFVPTSSDDSIYQVYDSDIDGHYNAWEYDIQNSLSDLHPELLYKEANCRFAYTHYSGTIDTFEKYGLDIDLLNENKIQAQLTCYVDNKLITATTNRDGLHVVFDDLGKPIGVYDGNGNQRDDVYFDEDSGFILWEENDEIVDSPNIKVEDVTPDNVIKDYEKDKSLLDFWGDLSSIVKIIIFIILVFLCGYLISTIVKAFRNLTLYRNVKSTNKMLKEFRKRRK